MDSYRRISAGFEQLMELISMMVDPLAEPLQQAAALCSNALLVEHKLICCGNGAGAAVAQLFCIGLIHRLERDRPALPAICLSSDGVTLSALATGAGCQDMYARQLRALGQAGDILLAVATATDNSSIIRAIQAAHERDMTCILLSGGAAADSANALHGEDIALHVPGQNPAHIIELQTMSVHCLCKLIDDSLFGPDEA